MNTRTARNIIQIDEDKCDGCGQCVIACAEGALAIVDGKARLVKESYCDGLGACIGECPQGALTIEARAADDFDQAAVEEHLARIGQAHEEPEPLACGCPGSMAQALPDQPAVEGEHTAPAVSHLRNWPVQLHLLPVEAPFYDGTRLLLAADCVPFAHPAFHHDLLRGHTLAIGCPKLDDAIFYVDKLAQILAANDIRGLTVAHMEVPCCFGLAHLAAQAVAKSGKDLPVETVVVGRDGQIRSTAPAGGCPHVREVM